MLCPNAAPPVLAVLGCELPQGDGLLPRAEAPPNAVPVAVEDPKTLEVAGVAAEGEPNADVPDEAENALGFG